MAYKMSKKEKEVLKAYASKLPIFPRVDYSDSSNPTLMTCQYSVSGYQLLNQGVKEFETKCPIKGPGKGNIVEREKTIKIEPNGKYLQTGFMMSDPYKYLENRIKKHGPSILSKAQDNYLKEYELSEKLQIKMSNARIPKPNTTESKVEVPGSPGL